MVVIHNDGPIAQLDRASVFETEGWAFESLWDHHPKLYGRVTGMTEMIKEMESLTWSKLQRFTD